MKTPSYTGEHVRSCGQTVRKAIDRFDLTSIHNTADSTLAVYPVEAAIFVAGIVCTHLVLRFHAPEVPINVIRRSNILSHIYFIACNYKYQVSGIWYQVLSVIEDSVWYL
jgi:hypothetical protein